MVKKNLKNKIFFIGSCLLILAIWVNYGLIGANSSKEHILSFAENMMRGIDYSEKLDVEDVDVSSNSYREKLGLYIIGKDWQKTYSFADKNAKAFIYLDAKEIPRILHITRGDLWVEEYQLKGEKYFTSLNGPAGIWNMSKGLIKAMNYKNNLLNGEVKIFTKDDAFISSKYKDDEIINGVSIEFYENGFLHNVKSYYGRLLSGLSYVYDDEGQIKAIENYKNGNKDGVQVYLYKNKVISKEYMYDGIMQKYISFDEDGDIRNEVNYSKKGFFLGEQREYSEGRISKLTCYSDPNRKHGPFDVQGHVQYFWHGENLGIDDRGKARYDKKWQIAKDQRDCPYKANPILEKIGDNFMKDKSPYSLNWQSLAKTSQ